MTPSPHEANVPRRVLVVDDHQDAAASLAEVLIAMGHEAQALCDPSLVIATCRAYQPDIVFLDIGMPRVSGYDVAKALREEYSYEALKLVAVTAYATAEDRRQARKAGFDAHVAKPADFDIIESILKTIR